MFLTRCSPASSNAKSSLSRTWSRTTRLTQIPPGSAKASSRAADIDTIAIDVAAVLDDVPEIDPDTELDALLLRHPDVAFGHLLLNLDGATHRIDNAGELDQQPVASRFNNAAAVLLDLRVGKLASQPLQRSESALLVRSHQTRIASDIGLQDRCEPPLDPCLCHRSRPRSRATAYYPWATAKA